MADDVLIHNVKFDERGLIPAIVQDAATLEEVALVDVASMEFGLRLHTLYSLIAERKEKRPEGSYTTYLFNSGLDKILKKVGEESTETIVAAKNEDSGRLVSETGDLLYHLLVLMVERGITLDEISTELRGRRK